MNVYVFGYGSLMNPDSVKKTLPGERSAQPARLRGYQRKINLPHSGYLYLNIVPRAGKEVEGVVLAITLDELEKLKEREVGYACTDVSTLLDQPFDGTVYTFIAPDSDFPTLTIPRSYILTCLRDKTDEQRSQWLHDTLIENLITEDTENPVYANVAIE